MPTNVLKALSPQLEWLLRSGIQAPPGGPEAGAVRAWLDETPGPPGFYYSEITGYFMSLCVQLHRHDKSRDWLSPARAAARWIIDRALQPSGGVLTRLYGPETAASAQYSFDDKVVLFFDCAMVGFGLALTHEATGDAAPLQAAQKIGDFLVRHFDLPPGQAGAAYDLKNDRPIPPANRWSKHFGSFQLKGALFLDLLSALTGQARYREFLERILRGALDSQLPEGRFPTDLPRETTHLHPHCYTLEGLLYMVARRGRRELLAPAGRGLDWMFRTCLTPGQLLQCWSTKPEQVIPGMRSDVLSQALRLYQLHKMLDPQARWSWESNIESLYQVLDTFTTRSGGTNYGSDENGPKPSHANAWCHFFNLEARLYRAARAGQLDFPLERLILT
jgi:hypothetical protein